MRIPIYSGFLEGKKPYERFQPYRHVGFIRDEATMLRYAGAKNVRLVKRKRDQAVVQVNVVIVLEEPEVGRNGKPVRGIGPNSTHPTYEEELSSGPLVLLKRINGEGEFERWPSDEGFNPKRFNPDALTSSLVRAYK